MYWPNIFIKLCTKLLIKSVYFSIVAMEYCIICVHFFKLIAASAASKTLCFMKDKSLHFKTTFLLKSVDLEILPGIAALLVFHLCYLENFDSKFNLLSVF